MFLFSTLFPLIILKGYAFAPDVSVDCPGSFIDNVVRNVTGSLNSSVLTTGPTGNCVFGVTLVNFFLIKGSNTPTLLCTQNFSKPTNVCDQNFNAQGCRCDRIVGNMFYYTYQFTANKLVQEGGVIQMKPNCLNASRQYPLVETLCNITFESITTTPPTTTRSTTLLTSYVSSSSVTNITITSGTTDHSSSGATDHLTPAPNCTDNCPQRSKCPDWCIAVSVCVPVGGGLIITITVIIIKKKKAKTQGSSVQDTKEMQDRTKHHGTENRPTPAQGGNNRTEERPTPAQSGNNRTEERPTPAQSGNNRTEESVQDTKEMQYKTKHLGTENSPEREKRRKKKKKKKTFQEVDGESVSRENKSTVNDHKAAQKSPNDNSVSVNENSPVTYNGELRRLPMPNIPHMTSVERNSTYFQSETPRKLPPLQPKAMIIP